MGEDPDGGECYAFNASGFNPGRVGDVDVSGLNFVRVVQIPGNVLTPKSWRQVVVVDQDATDDQRNALIAAFGGELGGPLADVAGLIGETVAVEHAKIEHDVDGGKGTLRIGDFVDSEMEPYREPETKVTTLRDSLFSTVPGSPAWVGKASKHIVNMPQHGMVWEYEGRNAIQADFKVSHTG